MNTRRGARRLAALWLALAALAAGARAAPRDDADPDALDAFDDADDELALDQEESRNLRPRAYPTGAYNALPSGFRPTASLAELAGYQRAPQQEPSAAPHHYAEQQGQLQGQLQSQPQGRPPQRKVAQAQRVQAQAQAQAEELEAEEEREEPDRLSQLLQQSRFDCVGKQSGYYADEELACEVFHYCQDSVKHSWICPDGFTFHQLNHALKCGSAFFFSVHLICMPPTHNNICQKSAKYHFVNEYLYRPINEEEVQRKPNVSLKYSDRYYPAEVYHDDRFDEDDGEEEEAPRRAPAAAARQTAAPPPSARPQPAAQVFRSPEEVNIPLLQRRPQRPYEFDF